MATNRFLGWRTWRRMWIAPVIALMFFTVAARAADTIERPFRGVRHIHRTVTQPRLLDMHIVEINLRDPAIRFKITPPNGPDVPGETTVATTRDYLTSTSAQLAINASFYVKPGLKNVDNIGLAVSEGEAYSTFAADQPAINLGRDNAATIVVQSKDDPTGYVPRPKVKLYNAVGGNEWILRGGKTVAQDKRLHPRTAVGITADRRLLMFVVDGRNPGHSLGMTTLEEAEVLKSFGAVDAINLDGGGSSTLVFADPKPRVVNVPVGLGNQPGSERPVGVNLAVFAAPMAKP